MASQNATGKNITPDREFTLSQKQYDLILHFLKNGVTPSLREIKEADLEGNSQGNQSRKVGKLSNFKSIAKRLRYRAVDNTLIFYGNSKIVLPNTKFVDVIKEVHRCKGEKHLNFTKTFEKLSEKYCMGLRQFGITEEKVREVVRACREGSCSKYYMMTPPKHQPAGQESLLRNSSTPPTLTMPRLNNAMVVGRPNQPLQQLALHSQYGQACIAVPCFFRMPTASVSSTPSILPKKPFILYAGSCGTKNPGYFASTSVPMATQPGFMPVQTTQGLIATNAMFIPSAAANMPNLAQLLAINPVQPLGPGQGQQPMGHGQQPLCQGQQQLGQGQVQLGSATSVPSSRNDSSCASERSGVSVTVYNPTVSTAATGADGSASLTNISETVGIINLQTGTGAVDQNNNLELQQQQSDDKDVIVIDPLGGAAETDGRTDVGAASFSGQDLEAHMKGPEMTESNQVYQNLATSDQDEPLCQIVASIQDMRSDILKAMAGSTQAPDLLWRKISYVEQMITAMKQYTEVFADDLDTRGDP